MGKFKYEKYRTPGMYVKGFAIALGQYSLITTEERKGIFSLTFNPLVEAEHRSSYKSTLSFSKAVESQGRQRTSGHQLPCGCEGIDVRIKNTSDEGYDVEG